METEDRTRSAGGVLRRRYVGGDAGRLALVERERANAEIAQMIHDRRTAAGLTQKQLAGLVGTRQSVISRLEDADYDGHSLSMRAGLPVRHTVDEIVSFLKANVPPGL